MDDLPSETLILILKNLKINDLISTSRVSKFFYSLSSDDRLWKDLFLQRFGYCSIIDNEKQLNKLKDDLEKQNELNTFNNNSSSSNNNSKNNSPKSNDNSNNNKISPSSIFLTSSNDSITNSNNNITKGIEESHDELMIKIYQRLNFYKVKVLLGYQKRIKGGWKHYYRKHVLLSLSKSLPESIQHNDSKLTEHLLSINLIKYNNTYLTAAELATKFNQTEYLEKILKFFPVDSILKDFYLHSYMRLITRAVQKNSVACAKLLLNYGADITYSNTNVLLMGSKYRTLTLNGEFGNKTIGTFQKLCYNNIELSYYFLDALLSQITFFLSVHSGNEMTLSEYVKTNRASVFSNKRTGSWDYGFEVLRFSGLFDEYNYSNHQSRLCRYNSNNNTPILNGQNNNINGNSNNISDTINGNEEIINHNHHSSIGSNDSGDDQILSLENMTKVKFSQFKMIEKTISQITANWSSEYCSYTPLHWSAKGGHINNIKTLFKMGADIHAKTASGKNVLDIAKENNRENCIPFLENQMNKLINICKFEPLFKLIKDGDVIGSIKFITQFMFEKQLKFIDKDIISKLIKYSIECNQPKIMSALYPCCVSNNDLDDCDGNTPIHYSSALGRIECLEVAIDQNGDINKVNKCYQTPLILATMNGHFEIVKHLLELGAKVDIPDWQLNTALHYSSPYPEIVKILLEYSSDPLQINYLYKNSLHSCIEISIATLNDYQDNQNKLNERKSNSLKLLLEYINDKNQINNPDIFGNTPLILTQYHNYLNNNNEINNGGGSSNNDEMSNILLRELKKNNLSTITSKTNILNLSFDDFNLISKKSVEELQEYLLTTNPLKPTVAMLAICKLDGKISLETFDRLKLQHHLMLESYFKKLKFQNCYSQMVQIFNNDLNSIQEILNTISQYQLKSFSYDSWEKIFSNYLIINRFEIPAFILSNLNNYMNSTTYIDRFQGFIINSLLHSPNIPEKYCRALLSPYRNRLDPSTFQSAIAYDNVIMLKSMIIREDIDSEIYDVDNNIQSNCKPIENNDSISYGTIVEFYHLPIPIYWIFSRIIKYGAIKCCKLLSSILFKKSVSLDLDINYSILSNISELRLIKNREPIIRILSEYNCELIIKALQDNPVSPNSSNAFIDYTLSGGSTTTTIELPIEIDYNKTLEIFTAMNLEKQQEQEEGEGNNNNNESIQTYQCQYCGIKNILDLDDHLLVCLNATTYQCPNKINGCQEKPMNKTQLLNHINKYCQYLHCAQCDSMFNRIEFIDHLFSHDSDTWEICSLCNQMLKGFSSCYKSDIIHIRDSNKNNNNKCNSQNQNHQENSNQNHSLLSSEYSHIKNCKNHFIKCHSCKLTLHKSELNDHKCLVISKLPIFRNLLNIQNNNLIDLI